MKFTSEDKQELYGQFILSGIVVLGLNLITLVIGTGTEKRDGLLLLLIVQLMLVSYKIWQDEFKKLKK